VDVLVVWAIIRRHLVATPAGRLPGVHFRVATGIALSYHLHIE
jgi:hypothetical protein